MLTHYLDDDPLLTGISTVILDEFHERSLHTDLGLALVAEAWRARRDLRVIVMSATMDPRPVQTYLDGCPLVAVASAAHPLEVSHVPDETVVGVLPAVLAAGPGDVLCFLPGAGEIERALQDARGIGERHDLDLLPLHGSLGADAQDRALLPGARRRVVMATNIAETSLTVPGVSLVVDGGWQKVARYDAERAIDTLVLERVTADSAAQRAGRAARLGPGRAWRLWDARDRLRPAREPEVDRVDLAGVVLGLMAAGSTPERFRWFEAPAPERLQAARELLERLGAIEGTRLTPFGHQVRRLPLHPRLACVLIAGGGAWEAAAACALLSEARPSVAAAAATTCDLLPLIDRWASVPPHTRQVAEAIHRLGRGVLGEAARDHIDEAQLRRALLAGFPDRVARRRANDRSKMVLASGRGATMGRESAVVDGEWLVAVRPDAHPVHALAVVQVVVLVAEDRPEVFVRLGRGDGRQGRHAAGLHVHVREREQRCRHPDHRPDHGTPDAGARDDELGVDVARGRGQAEHPAVVVTDPGDGDAVDEARAALDRAAADHFDHPDRLGEPVGGHVIAPVEDGRIQQRRQRDALLGRDDARLDAP